jgi:hypothetical protein
LGVPDTPKLSSFYSSPETCLFLALRCFPTRGKYFSPTPFVV